MGLSIFFTWLISHGLLEMFHIALAEMNFVKTMLVVARVKAILEFTHVYILS